MGLTPTLKPTPEQKLIVKHQHANAMVVAGPGCAITSTMALRAKHMLDQGYGPESIVILIRRCVLVPKLTFLSFS
ncbi:hypothetical protein [Methylobacter svalbardensis]|uniref:hypothetical protein n=1 Tax=Methylobacter svalbardensis TaxID=3080016 RepID=UPI0030EC7A95